MNPWQPELKGPSQRPDKKDTLLCQLDSDSILSKLPQEVQLGDAHNLLQRGGPLGHPCWLPLVPVGHLAVLFRADRVPRGLWLQITATFLSQPPQAPNNNSPAPRGVLGTGTLTLVRELSVQSAGGLLEHGAVVAEVARAGWPQVLGGPWTCEDGQGRTQPGPTVAEAASPKYDAS